MVSTAAITIKVGTGFAIREDRQGPSYCISRLFFQGLPGPRHALTLALDWIQYDFSCRSIASKM